MREAEAGGRPEVGLQFQGVAERQGVPGTADLLGVMFNNGVRCGPEVGPRCVCVWGGDQKVVGTGRPQDLPGRSPLFLLGQEEF